MTTTAMKRIIATAIWIQISIPLFTTTTTTTTHVEAFQSHFSARPRPRTSSIRSRKLGHRHRHRIGTSPSPSLSSSYYHPNSSDHSTLYQTKRPIDVSNDEIDTGESEGDNFNDNDNDNANGSDSSSPANAKTNKSADPPVNVNDHGSNSSIEFSSVASVSSTTGKGNATFSPSTAITATDNTNPNPNPTSSLSSRRRTVTILTILTATTLNLLGFTLTSPLNPTIGKHFKLPTGASFGSLTSAYPAGMLLGLILWPRLSDLPFFGRKKILAFSLLGSGVGLSLQSLAVWQYWSLEAFLATRIFTGVFSGSAPVAKAFLADLGDEENKEVMMAMEMEMEKNDDNINMDSGKGKRKESKKRDGTAVAKYLGWRDAAATLSYILGPALGGILYEFVRNWGHRSRTAATSTSVQLGSSVKWLNQGRPFGGGIGGSGVAASASASAATVDAFRRGGALSVVIGVSAVASLIASFLIMTLVKDIPKSSASASANAGTGKPPVKENTTTVNANNSNKEMEEATKDDLEIMSCPLGSSLWTSVATVCVISFLYHIADSTFFAFYPAHLQNTFHLNARDIGVSFTGLACISFLFSATSLSSKLVKKVGTVNTCAAGLGTVSAGLCALSVSSSPAAVALGGVGLVKFVTYAAAMLYFCGVPLYGPTVPMMLLLCVPPYQRGAVMGIDGAINTLARIVSPLIMGGIYERYGATRAFALAGAAAFTSGSMALFRRFLVVRKQRAGSV